MQPHIVLLGDSVFDNGAYVSGGPDVIAQLREALTKDARATLLARDGAVTRDVTTQLKNLPSDTTHLVISAGGNDALGVSGILEERAASVAEVLARVADIQDRFRDDYREMIEAAAATRLPVAVSTIYDPRFEDPIRRRIGTTALAVFNDVITREAFSRGIDVLDLRLICNEDADFANPIEPSSRGGAKIASAIAKLVSGGADSSRAIGRP